VDYELWSPELAREETVVVSAGENVRAGHLRCPELAREETVVVSPACRQAGSLL